MRSTQGDMHEITFNTLAAAGYGLAYEFGEAASGSGGKPGSSGFVDSSDKHRIDYRDTLSYVVKNMGILALFMILGQIGWPRSMTMGRLRTVAAAKDKLEYSMGQMLDQERRRIQSGDPGASNFLSALIRYSGQGVDENGGGGTSTTGKILLNDEEVYGNLFVYLVGGFTTANALTFAVTRMAIEPHLQDWVAEEIDAIIGKDGASTPSYEAAFARLTRCLAIMVSPGTTSPLTQSSSMIAITQV